MYNTMPVSEREFSTLLDEVVNQSTFRVLDEWTLSADEFREMHRQKIGLDDSGPIFYGQPQVPQDPLKKLIQQLRLVLDKYIVNDGVGNGFASIVQGQIVIAVADLAKTLVRASAILGSDQATQILFGWAQGTPVPYRTYAILAGIYIEQSLDMEGGINLIGLPGVSTEISEYLPWNITQTNDMTAFLGEVKATIECKAQPAFYRFSECNRGFSNKIWSYGTFSDVSLDRLCEALSLACDNFVAWRICWFECDAVKEFTKLGAGMVRIPSTYEPARHINPKEISQHQVTEAHSILKKLLENSNRKDGLDLAIHRWMKSKQHTNHSDQMIELRIALESLYLWRSGSGESSFRLATRGAWHLGANYQERRKHYETLRRFYNLASRVVHAGQIKYNVSDIELLIAAQDLCRKAILKRLDKGEAPNWDELIFGKQFDALP